MVETIERPDTLIEDLLGIDKGFPDSLFLLEVENGKYGAVGHIPKGYSKQFEFLATFENPEQVKLFSSQYKLSGKEKQCSLEEALNIAKSKPRLSGIALQVDGSTVEVMWTS